MQPVFIIILDEILVARDIELVIGDMRPEAQVIVALSLQEATERIPLGRIEAVFLQREIAQFRGSALWQRMVDDGGRVVLVGVEPEIAAEGMLELSFPFTDQYVADVLAGMTRA